MSDKIYEENMRFIRSRRLKREAVPERIQAKSERKSKKPKKEKPLIESNRQGRELFVAPKTFIKFGVEDAIIPPENAKLSRPKRSAETEPSKPTRRQRKPKKPKAPTSAESTETPQPSIFPPINEKKYVPSPPRDIIKFELIDAKVPGTENFRNFRLPFDIADNKNSTKGNRKSRATAIFKRDTPPNPSMADSSSNESRRIKIVTPLSSKKSKYQLYEELPMAIQKAIDGAVLEHRKKNGNTGDYLKFYYGDKIIRAPKNYKPFPLKDTTDGGMQSDWSPLMKPSQLMSEYKFEDPFEVNTKFLGTKPSYTQFKTAVKPDAKEKTKLHLVEKPIPLKFENLPGKITVEPSISISYESHTDHDDFRLTPSKMEANPYGPVEIAMSTPDPLFRFPSDKPQSYVNFKTPKGGYKVEEEIESALPKLSALIGRKPNEQLKKFKEILNNDPKKSTSPILFPTSPVPPLSADEPHSFTIITTEDDPKEYKYEVEPAVQKFRHTPKYQRVVKQFIPITENLSENYEGVYKATMPAPKEKRVTRHHVVKAPTNVSINLLEVT